MMAFLGDTDFLEGRSASKTTALVLRRCLGCAKQDEERSIDEFLEGLRIKPSAFFRDIDGDWNGRPFIGQHVFKVVQAAGYQGTENDLWTTVTGDPAPYPVKAPKSPSPKKAKAKVQPNGLTVAKSDGTVDKPARRTARAKPLKIAKAR